MTKSGLTAQGSSGSSKRAVGVRLSLVKLDGSALASSTPTTHDSGYTKHNQMLPAPSIFFFSKESNL